jgi:2-C-methyl-D-erythritol 4-phosphate cytidylyltransferase/2-C-methyl-D-erythritol 2,4-cyclodiphosphate synthase
MSGIATLIVAAGTGERVGGGTPKQFRRVQGAPLLRRSAAAIARAIPSSMLQVVIGAGQERQAEDALEGIAHLPFVTGGATRQDSVRRGLEALEGHAPEFVLIHDAARPFISQKLIDALIAELRSGADAAIPLLAVADTLKRAAGEGQWETVSRDGLHRAQTPQAFRYPVILAAHRKYAATPVTDDMALAEIAGIKVAAVAGEDINFKITRAEDFLLAEQLLAGTAEFRTGFGLDDHVWLCGVKIPHDASLAGHSDADAGLHALTDAILGAIGQGDIGQHFPPTDEKWRGATSSVFLEHAAKLVGDAGGEITHCDVTLICERPKVSPYRDAMRARIAEILAIDVGRVSVKATTTEGMGFTGRKEGLAAQAVATVRMTGRDS